MDKSQAFRDDLAARRMAYGIDPGAKAAASVSYVTDSDGARYKRVDHDGVVSYYPEPAEPVAEVCGDDQAVDFFSQGCDESAVVTQHEWGTLSVTPANPEKRAARVSDLVTITINVCTDPWEDIYKRLINDLLCVVESDEPGIAAMAAKNVQPAPEPVVRIAGIESTEREIAEALQLLRAKNAPPAEKQAPVGLMFRDDSFDHRLGAWGR